MAWFRRSSRFIILVLAVALTLGLAVNVPAQVQAQLSPPSLSSQLPNQSNFRPPRTATGSPENTQGGATRSDCFVEEKKFPAPLVPASKMGETLAEYPTVSWYMPKTRASAMKFVLLGPADKQEANEQDADKQEANKQEVYSVQYSLAKYTEGPDKDENKFVVGSPGIMSFTVPTATGIPPMAIGQEYHWQLKFICSSDPTDNSLNIRPMEGGIKRVEPNPTLAPRLQQATPQERVTLYTEENLWYDAVATLVELGRDRPNDPNLAATWDQLLKSQGL